MNKTIEKEIINRLKKEIKKPLYGLPDKLSKPVISLLPNSK